jgi:hypothetical protein
VKLYEINSQIETLWQHADEAFEAGTASTLHGLAEVVTKNTIQIK